MYKKSYYGTVSYMPGLFGLHMASVVIREIGQEAKLFYTSKRRHLHRQVRTLIPSTTHRIHHRSSSINPRKPNPSFHQPCNIPTIDHLAWTEQATA